MQLSEGMLALWRREGETQIGTDPRSAVVLEGLTAPQQRAVDVLARRPARSVTELARLAEAPVDQTRAVARRLVALDLLVDVPRSLRPPAAAPTGGSDRRSGRAEDPRAARERSSVLVVGGDVLGLHLARLVAASGVGTVAVSDPGPVLGTDVSALGYHPGDVDVRREVAAVTHLRHARADVRTRVPERPDLVVLVESRVSVPFRSSALVREDVTHLSVVWRERDVVVGPAVRPGRDACLRCLDLHRRDADPCWPALATQLAVAPPPLGEISTVASAGGLACAAVLLVLAGEGSAPFGFTAEVAPGGVARRRWAPHPACGCGAHREHLGGAGT